MRLKEPVAIIEGYRSPFGRLGGALAGYEAHELLARIFRHVADTSPGDLDEVIVGSVRDGIGNIARVAALAAQLPVDLPAMTLDRQCASSMEALATAAAKINAGLAERILLGGVDSASRCPWLMEKTARPYDYFEPRPFKIRLATEDIGDPSMGETAEILADEFDISREEMDAFALESHRRAVAAGKRGFFQGEIVALPATGKRDAAPVACDESVREDTSLERLAKLRPAFRRDGRVTAGNSSPLSDGAAAALVCSQEVCARVGGAPMGWLKGVATVALTPGRMGMGPALAIPKLLDACGLQKEDVDLFEINEAFAGQILAVNRELKIPAEKLNVNGGAVAIGHPFGATGLRLVMTLIHALRERNLNRGVASLCIGGGQGMAVLVELQA
jgi:acetyl-CoA acetyltransferase family protein